MKKFAKLAAEMGKKRSGAALAAEKKRVPYMCFYRPESFDRPWLGESASMSVCDQWPDEDMVFKGGRWMHPSCHKHWQSERDRKEALQKQITLDPKRSALRRFRGLPPDWVDMKPLPQGEDEERYLYRRVTQWLDNNARPGLVFFGPAGRLKTSTAVWAVTKWLIVNPNKQGQWMDWGIWHGKLSDVYTSGSRVSQADRERALFECDILLVDNIVPGPKTLTDTKYDRLRNIVTLRTQYRRPFVITTNYSSAKLREVEQSITGGPEPLAGLMAEKCVIVTIEENQIRNWRLPE